MDLHHVAASAGSGLTARPVQFAALWQRWREDRRGAVAIIFALTTLPLFGVVGSAIDYTHISRAKARLDASADAAALSGARLTHQATTTASAQAMATQTFNVNLGTMERINVTSLNVQVSDTSGTRTANVTYSANFSTYFMGIFGINSVAISGTSTASSSKPPYMDFYLLLDNTPSMGLGATPTDISRLQAATPDQCAFACHDKSDPKKNYYKTARDLGITLRVDVVRQAAQQLMDTAMSAQVVPSQYRAAIYTFGTSCDKRALDRIIGITENLSNAKRDAGRIDLMTMPYRDFYVDSCTAHKATLEDINRIIPAQGTGASSGSTEKVLMLVTDGVTDYYYPNDCTRTTYYGRCIEAANPNYCRTLKDRGITIAVLYTTYIPLPNDSWYNWQVAPFQPTIADRMRDCASPGLFFEVSPSQGISEAMNALFHKAVASARLTR